MKPSQPLRYNTIKFSNISGCSGFLRVSNYRLRVSELIKTDILRSNPIKTGKSWWGKSEVGGAAVPPTVQEAPPLSVDENEHSHSFMLLGQHSCQILSAPLRALSCLNYFFILLGYNITIESLIVFNQCCSKTVIFTLIFALCHLYVNISTLAMIQQSSS